MCMHQSLLNSIKIIMAQALINTTPILSYSDLCKSLDGIDSTIRFCRGRKLMSTQMECVGCPCQCRQVKRARYYLPINNDSSNVSMCTLLIILLHNYNYRYPEGMCWRCPRKGCQKVVSLRKDSFFSDSKLPLETILKLLHQWSTKTPVTTMMRECKV